MFKKCFVAAAIVMASPAFASAQDIFWSFSPTELNPNFTSDLDNSETGSAYIFSDGFFGFDAIDLEFTVSDSDVVRFTGGEAFNPTYNIIGGTRFDFSEITVDADGGSGGLFSVNLTQNGVFPAILELFDPGFVAGAGPNGAVLLARVDFDVIGTGTADLEFTLGPQGALELPSNVLNPSFGSATLIAGFSVNPLCVEPDYSLGDVNLSGGEVVSVFLGDGIDVCYSVNAFDIAPFIAVLASGGYQREADCNEDGFVNFFDIAPFIVILSSELGKA